MNFFNKTTTNKQKIIVGHKILRNLSRVQLLSTCAKDHRFYPQIDEVRKSDYLGDELLVFHKADTSETNKSSKRHFPAADMKQALAKIPTTLPPSASCGQTATDPKSQTLTLFVSTKFNYKKISFVLSGDLKLGYWELLKQSRVLKPSQTDSRLHASQAKLFDLLSTCVRLATPTCVDLRWLWSSSNSYASRCKFLIVWPPTASRQVRSAYASCSIFDFCDLRELANPFGQGFTALSQVDTDRKRLNKLADRLASQVHTPLKSSTQWRLHFHETNSTPGDP